jgi:hypothetical protein
MRKATTRNIPNKTTQAHNIHIHTYTHDKNDIIQLNTMMCVWVYGYVVCGMWFVTCGMPQVSPSASYSLPGGPVVLAYSTLVLQQSEMYNIETWIL